MDNLNTISGLELHVLILEDSQYDLELIEELLTDAGYLLRLTHVEHQAGFEAALQNEPFDMILSDFSLPGFNAFGALDIRNRLCPDTPFICISGSIGEMTAIDLLKQGAVDYVLKDRPERLPFAVKRALDEAKENYAYKQAVKELKESKMRFEQVAEDAQEWIWEVDADGLYTYASPVVESLLGYSSDEVVGKKHFYDFFHPDVKDQLKSAALAAFARRENFRHFQNPNIHKDGRVLILSTSGSPVFNSDGEFIGYRGVDSDITERSKMLEELVQAKEKAEESDKLKTAFINNISHEIRTPLNSILGFGQFLSERDLTPEQRREYYSIIEKSSLRLINTVSDYIDMARIVSGTLEAHEKDFLLQPFFQELVEQCRLSCTEKELLFEAVYPVERSEVSICSDPEFISKSLNILLDNALKFTTSGKIRCGYTLSGGLIHFFVEDTGCGIAQDKLERIFDMFSQEDASNTRGYEGSGLGLSIAQGLIRFLGGNLMVSSVKGKGTLCQFEVPVKILKQHPSTPIIDRKDTKASKRPLVLIAEDEDSNYLFLKVLLNMIGCDSLHAANGAEAVELCREREDITLILMDIKMPVMNGLEATEHIHAFKPEMPIIATTAFAQSGDEHRFLSAGCNGYLAKPINKNNLRQLVEQYSRIQY